MRVPFTPGNVLRVRLGAQSATMPQTSGPSDCLRTTSQSLAVSLSAVCPAGILPGLHHLRSCLVSSLHPAHPARPLALPVILFSQSILGSIFWQSGCRMHTTWYLGHLPTGGVHLGLSVLHHSSLASHLYPHCCSASACCIPHIDVLPRQLPCTSPNRIPHDCE